MGKITKIIVAIVVLGIVGFLIIGNNLPGRSGSSLYQNEKHGFSFKIIENMTVGEPVVDENEGETILIQINKPGETYESYQTQIYITPFDEDISLTTERIKTDIPDIRMKGESEIKVDGVAGVKFIDEDQNTEEIWFVRSGYLYQISNDEASSVFAGKLINGWKWE